RPRSHAFALRMRWSSVCTRSIVTAASTSCGRSSLERKRSPSIGSRQARRCFATTGGRPGAIQRSRRGEERCRLINRSTERRLTFATLLLASIAALGCREPRIDGSSPERTRRTITAARASLPPEQRRDFDRYLGLLLRRG